MGVPFLTAPVTEEPDLTVWSANTVPSQAFLVLPTTFLFSFETIKS